MQTCIVHLLRHSLDFVSWKDRKPVAAALKEIYRVVDADAGEAALTAFEEGYCGQKHLPSARAGVTAWAEVIPFYAFPGQAAANFIHDEGYRGVECQTPPGGSSQGSVPNFKAATKLLFLVLNC